MTNQEDDASTAGGIQIVESILSAASVNISTVIDIQTVVVDDNDRDNE